jgi:type IV pilus assembly protein PilA
MIVIAIIGILAAIAIPAYQNYIKRAAYTEVTTGMAPIKTAINVCYASTLDLAVCDTADDIGETLPTAGTLALKSIGLTATTAAITATPNDYKGIATAETCVLTPEEEIVSTKKTGRLVWEFSGACVTKGYVKN